MFRSARPSAHTGHVAQLDRALPSGGRGRGFESRHVQNGPPVLRREARCVLAQRVVADLAARAVPPTAGWIFLDFPASRGYDNSGGYEKQTSRVWVIREVDGTSTEVTETGGTACAVHLPEGECVLSQRGQLCTSHPSVSAGFWPARWTTTLTFVDNRFKQRINRIGPLLRAHHGV